MHKWINLWPTVLCSAGIFWLSVIKTPSIKITDHWFFDNIDKIGHFIAYAILLLSAFWSFSKIFKGNKINIKQIIILGLTCFIYGLIIECFQHFIPYRDFDAFDLIANTSGIAFGTYLINRFYA